MVATDGKFEDGTVKEIGWQVWSKNTTSDSLAVLLVNAGDSTQDVSVEFDGMVPCRPKGRCEEMHLNVLCAAPCPDDLEAGAVSMTARDLWERQWLPDVTGGTLVAKQLPPHGSLFVLLTRKD